MTRFLSVIIGCDAPGGVRTAGPASTDPDGSGASVDTSAPAEAPTADTGTRVRGEWTLVFDGPVVELPEGGAYSSLRFAPGIGEFRRTELFVTDRYEMFVADLGIEGRHVLAGWPAR